MREIILSISIIFFSASIVFSQGELAEKDEIFFKNEASMGFRLNTNGWSINYRRGTFVNPKNKNLWELEYNTIKHAKETKQFFYSLETSTKRYVYGKKNYCFDLRSGVGRQKTLYKKADKNSVEIRLITFTGGSLALLKPIYYVVNDNGTVRIERFEGSHQQGTIENREPFIRGITETTINPGLYFKVGISFEYSKYEKQLSALEIGINSYAYLKKMDIMAEVPNHRLFVTLFLNYRMGNVFHGGHHKSRNDDL